MWHDDLNCAESCENDNHAEWRWCSDNFAADEMT